MGRAAVIPALLLCGLLLFASGASAQLPQGLTCGISYTSTTGCIFGLRCTPVIGIQGFCDGVPTVSLTGDFDYCTPCSACKCSAPCQAGDVCQMNRDKTLIYRNAAGYTYVKDGDVGDTTGYGFVHQERLAGVTYRDFTATPPTLPTDFVLPKGTACGFHHTYASPGKTCMGYNPGLDPANVNNLEPLPPPALEVRHGCPDGWNRRKAFDMSSGGGHWVWCEYDDPMHRSIGASALTETGIACGISHNAGADTGEDRGPTCMGYRPLDGSTPVCPPTTTGFGWLDLGRPEGIGLGFCATTTQTMPPPAPARGFLDTTFTTSGTFNGWAYDPNAPEVSIAVDLYIDGPAGSGAPGFRVTANGARPDVNSYFNIVGNHGYSFTLPAQYLGASHTVYAYGISLFGQANPLLAQSPGRYSAPAPEPPPPPLCRNCVTP